MTAALEEYADIIDRTINNGLFYKNGGVHVVDVPLGAVLVLLQQLLHHEQNPEKHTEPGGVEFLAEEAEDVRADGCVVAAGACGRGRGGGGAVILVAVERHGGGSTGADLRDYPAHQPFDLVEEEGRLLLPPPSPQLVVVVEHRRAPPLLPPLHGRSLGEQERLLLVTNPRTVGKNNG